MHFRQSNNKWATLNMGAKLGLKRLKLVHFQPLTEVVKTHLIRLFSQRRLSCVQMAPAKDHLLLHILT